MIIWKSTRWDWLWLAWFHLDSNVAFVTRIPASKCLKVPQMPGHEARDLGLGWQLRTATGLKSLSCNCHQCTVPINDPEYWYTRAEWGSASIGNPPVWMMSLPTGASVGRWGANPLRMLREGHWTHTAGKHRILISRFFQFKNLCCKINKWVFLHRKFFHLNYSYVNHVYTHISMSILMHIYIYKLYTCTRASREVRSCFIFSFGHPSFVNLSI